MKVFDFLMYMMYTASRRKRYTYKTQEEYARQYFCFLFASLGALLITTMLFKIEPYRLFLYRIMPWLGVLLFGMAQVLVTGYIIYSRIAKYYTDERIRSVDAAYTGALSRGAAIALYAVLYVLNTLSFIYLLFDFIFTLLGKKAHVNL